MKLDFIFIVNSILLGVALAMDAFSVSLANGLEHPKAKRKEVCLIAGTFCFFQIIMPLIGWFCVKTIADKFTLFQKMIPFIALALLGFIGVKMIIEGIKNDDVKTDGKGIGLISLLVQGIATSIDALSVGFTIADYSFPYALIESLIIGVVTFVICVLGVLIGKKFGTKLAGKATLLGGIILLCIGIEIFVKGVFF